MLLLSDPLVAAVPIHDCGEELVDLRDLPELAVDPRKESPEGVWARLRVGVLARLLTAQQSLPAGVRLLIIEGYRPAALQQHYFDGHYAELAGDHPDWAAELLTAEASKHVSPPAVAPHPCGAAVDLTVTRDGTELDLGTRINATPAESSNACFTDADNISEAARAARMMLSEALAGAGLVNYPPEWWHWSYGDRYWAAVTGAPRAMYEPL